MKKIDSCFFGVHKWIYGIAVLPTEINITPFNLIISHHGTATIDGHFYFVKWCDRCDKKVFKAPFDNLPGDSKFVYCEVFDQERFDKAW